ncbi:hypothetical protein PN36_14010 [Candidatus Thiomargarita nelsonii]|uniref:GmrSD restriction endonucleases N-terminal domain-containing protein n=1 Tax=Candidatus Thiomargarita nelsonii TaxID=1003181 RepID=A0A4E0QTJ2_9GAMM|nr:hypothetical protein PN36_14010 [Candidatus Thiomargarita nelsonii]
MAIWKAYRVSDAITEVEDEKFVLPVIQRRLVWDEEKMELLFDTLLKGDSFGGIMVIEEEKGSKPLFNYRPFTKDGGIIQSREIEELTQQQFFVIDGQQRIQSFYIGLKGSLNGKVMYFDLFSDFNSEFEFKFENSETKLPKQSKDNAERPVPEHNWYLVSSLLKRLKDTNDDEQVADEIISSRKIDDTSKKKHVRKNVKAFYKNIITAKTLGMSQVSINKTFDEVSNKQRIVELFRRLNDGGTKLSSFDLVASILKGFSWEMEGFLEKMLEEYEDIGLSQDNLIKLIFLLQDDHKKEMASIEGKDAEFAITNKDRINSTLKSVKDFLIHAELYNYYKDGNRSFIPLFFVAYHLFYKDIDAKSLYVYFDNYDAGNVDYPIMYKWIYHSLLNGVYRSRGAGWVAYKTGVRKLLAEIKKHKNMVFPKEALFNVYIEHPVVFSQSYKVENLDSLDRSFLYYLMYDRNQTIRNQDIDHIMPKSILASLKYGWDEINSIKNFQLIDYKTNRGIKNGKPFKDWMNNDVSDKPSFVKRHLIPDDEGMWGESRFADFLEKRAGLILAKISKYLP